MKPGDEKIDEDPPSAHLVLFAQTFVQSRGIVGPRIEDAVFSNAVQHRKYFGRGMRHLALRARIASAQQGEYGE